MCDYTHRDSYPPQDEQEGGRMRDIDSIIEQSEKILGIEPRKAKKDFAYYQNLRRTNKAQYYRRATQDQMIKDRLAQGRSFYGGHNE